MNRTITVVTDIPLPYRVHLFNAIHRELTAVGMSFEVLFMARTVAIRFWEFDANRCEFPFRIIAGVHPRYGNNWFHFNPGILWRVFRTRPTWLVVGGAWNMPTVVGLLFLRRLQRVGTTALWSEANFSSMHFTRGLIPRIRAVIASQVDAFVVPGRVARETIQTNWGNKGKPFIQLPNVADEALFRDRVQSLRAVRASLRRRRQLSDTDVVLLWPARLHEQTKGIINFLEAVHDILPQRIVILIVGEGPDRPLIERWLRAATVPGAVLLGHQSEQNMVELYALADVLLLPSQRDPNPLSVVEALWSGLALLISRNCGNAPEALEQGRNGWLVDPSSPESMRAAVLDLAKRTPQELRQFGERSTRIASKYFSTEHSVKHFLQELLALPLWSQPEPRVRGARRAD